MMTISEFAKICNTTVKTLRYYDRIGLLSSDYISPQTGYRYYRRSSAVRYCKIAALKQAGFTLREIKDVAGALSFGEIGSLLDKKAEQFERQRYACLQLKADYERLLDQPAAYRIELRDDRVDITERATGTRLSLSAEPTCRESFYRMLIRGMDTENLIGLAYSDMEELLRGKTACEWGSHYCADAANGDVPDSLYVAAQRVDAVILHFSCAPDTPLDDVFEAIESALLSFREHIPVLFAADLESERHGVFLEWICMRSS